jgi:hypothetical protein
MSVRQYTSGRLPGIPEAPFKTLLPQCLTSLGTNGGGLLLFFFLERHLICCITENLQGPISLSRNENH